jgi:hypothetical protein
MGPITCRNCETPIENPKPGQDFCANQGRCRQDWHKNHKRRLGIPGTISSLRLLKGGKISMVIRFDVADRNRITAFSQGQKIKVID